MKPISKKNNIDYIQDKIISGKGLTPNQAALLLRELWKYESLAQTEADTDYYGKGIANTVHFVLLFSGYNLANHIADQMNTTLDHLAEMGNFTELKNKLQQEDAEYRSRYKRAKDAEYQFDALITWSTPCKTCQSWGKVDNPEWPRILAEQGDKPFDQPVTNIGMKYEMCPECEGQAYDHHLIVLNDTQLRKCTLCQRGRVDKL